MDFHYFVGIDIAKDTLDWAVFNQQGVQLRLHQPNSVEGIKDTLRQIKNLPNWSAQHTVFCMEHTARAAPRHLQHASAVVSPSSGLSHLVRVLFAD